MDKKDEEIEYLENRVKDLEVLVQTLAREKKKELFGVHEPQFSFGFDDTSKDTTKEICSMCGTCHNVHFRRGIDVFLCTNCVSNWS